MRFAKVTREGQYIKPPHSKVRDGQLMTFLKLFLGGIFGLFDSDPSLAPAVVAHLSSLMGPWFCFDLT